MSLGIPKYDYGHETRPGVILGLFRVGLSHVRPIFEKKIPSFSKKLPCFSKKLNDARSFLFIRINHR